MDEGDFHSLNKGVFVVPFDGEAAEAGPSRRPLGKVYDLACQRLDEAKESYEAQLAAEQLDEIADWLSRCAAPPALRQSFSTRRLPVALMQSISPGVATHISSVCPTVAVVNGRDMQDFATATRAVAAAFVGDVALEAKKAGRTPLDEVERWALKRNCSPMLLLIEQAQVVPSAVLSEVIYSMTLHPSIPLRLLISVPAIRTFISNWTLIEPSVVDLSILSSGSARTRLGAVNALLDTAKDATVTPFAVSEAVADDLQSDEQLTGGGSAGALRSLKWLLLRHSLSTPVSGPPSGQNDMSEQASRLQALAGKVREGEHEAASSYFSVESTGDSISTQNPAPRMSILGAMSKSATFLPTTGSGASEGAMSQPVLVAERSTPSSTALDLDGDRIPDADHRLLPETNAPEEQGDGEHRSSGDGPSSQLPPVCSREADTAQAPFRELEAMFALWQSSGKSISLWDWLEGFRHAMDDDENGDPAPDGENGDVLGTEGGKRKRADGDDASAAVDEEEAARLHARFIRFVEESRMIGLVRARGKGPGKRSDEVAKGVLMV